MNNVYHRKLLQILEVHMSSEAAQNTAVVIDMEVIQPLIEAALKKARTQDLLEDEQ